MTQSEFVRPPRLAAWLLNLFTSGEEAESIPGDLHEEFSQVVSKAGVAFARRWYWRQTVKTVPHLAALGLRSAFWSTAAAIVGGFLLCRFVYWLPDKLLALVTEMYLGYWSTHVKAYMLLATDGMFVAHLMASLLVGCAVALAAKRREMIATIALGVIFLVLGMAASLAWLVRTGDVWLPILVCADSLAIVVGGALIRMRRARAPASMAMEH